MLAVTIFLFEESLVIIILLVHVFAEFLGDFALPWETIDDLHLLIIFMFWNGSGIFLFGRSWNWWSEADELDFFGSHVHCNILRIMQLFDVVHDVFNIGNLLDGEESEDCDEDEAKARFCLEFASESRSVLSGHFPATLTQGHDLCENEESDMCES